MRHIALYLGAFLCAGVVASAAAGQIAASDSAKLKSGDPQEAVVNVKTKFTSINTACFAFTFSQENPLDPGESLRITPTVWLKDNPYDRGPGLSNISEYPQYSRLVCPMNCPGYPLDRLLVELLDGKEHLTLNADDGPVTVTRLFVTIDGTPVAHD
jgi:hypothetical protein